MTRVEVLQLGEPVVEEEEVERVGVGEEKVILLLADWIKRIRSLDRDPFLDYHGRDQRPVNPRNALRADPYYGFRKGVAMCRRGHSFNANYFLRGYSHETKGYS
jgi:hypothetical protein